MAKRLVDRADVGSDEEKKAAVRRALVSWFRQSGRDLPWRRTRDPWRILVSEVMLQQIQVKRAIPFYERFLDRFPTVGSLAAAPLADAIRVWGDLGRYRRVANLHRTAGIVVDEHGGRIPSDPEVLVKLPGIGPYTAGAVACFAYEKDVPFFDTNIHRVLHRVFFGSDVPEPTAKAREILELAADLVPAREGWAWNQAVMEFGALRCTARRPLCDTCPLQDACLAHPGVLEALAGVPRAARGAKSAGYEGSNRHLRGRVLALLREDSTGGVNLADLGDSLLGDSTEAAMLRMREVVGSLERDGLARILWPGPPPSTEARPAESVAEERAGYVAGNGSETGGEDLTNIRVALP